MTDERQIEPSIEAKRKLFESDFWSEVYGAKWAVRHMRHNGGVLIKLGSINTPFPHHAVNDLDREPRHVRPEERAAAAAMATMAPRLTDLFMERRIFSGTHSEEPPRSADELQSVAELRGRTRPLHTHADSGRGHIAEPLIPPAAVTFFPR